MIEVKDLISILNRMLKDDVSIEEYSDDAFTYRLFYEIYQQVPYVMYFFDGIDDEDEMDGEFDLKETYNNIINSTNCLVYPWKGNKLLIGDGWMTFKGTIFNIKNEVPDELSECIELTKKDTANLIFVSVSSRGGFVKKLLPVNEYDVDFNINYNEDFPHERLQELISSDKSELILAFGHPGCGKTVWIRKMIKDNPDLKFYWLDSSMFRMINSTEFMEFLLDCKGGVFVLEDCETILKDRNTNYNDLINPILNISDGMLGDSLHLKFICTFNTDLSNVDEALLRKGRLSLKYEFKPLVKDRVQKLFDKLGIDATAEKDMPLCDVYNYETENGQKEKKKIGF